MANINFMNEKVRSAFHSVESTTDKSVVVALSSSSTSAVNGGSLTNLSAIAIRESMGIAGNGSETISAEPVNSQVIDTSIMNSSSIQQPNMAMCSSLLQSLNEDGYHGDGEGDSVSPDLEVASVLFPDGRLKSPTLMMKRVCSSTSSSSKSSYSPLKQPTTFTNKQRGNIQTATPTLFQELTPHQLAAQGELTLLAEKLQKGLDVDIQDENGHTPIMWACSQNQTTIVEYLLDKGADANICNIDGETALAFACSYGSVEIVQLLLMVGVDVNVYDMNGGTPFVYAVYNNHPKCVQLLLQNGADLAMATESGHTPLSIAMTMGHQTVQHTIEDYLLSMLEES
ncbi:uncharacterized protein LOC144443584 [Glandiceps talaboti]